MKETTGDIFDYLKDPETDAICIFTNGIVDKNGNAMAGAGQAGAAANRWWNFRYNLGAHIKENGNIVGVVGKVEWFQATQFSTQLEESKLLVPQWNKDKGGKPYIIAFPTKQHFMKPSIPSLVEESTKQIVKLADEMKFKKVILGRPGCGKYTGKLDWDKEVKPLIQNVLDDRFLIVTKQ